MDFQLQTYFPVFIFLLAIIAFAAVTLLLAHRIGPRKRTPVKLMPYESGMDPIGDTRRRFDVKFYLVAILFLVFDVELLFLYPWAVAAYQEGRTAGRTQEPRVLGSAGLHRDVGGGLRLCLAERGVPMALALPENVMAPGSTTWRTGCARTVCGQCRSPRPAAASS